jgi:hypothetical protein
MADVYFDAIDDARQRLERLYTGAIYVYSPTAPSLALCQFARDLAEEAFQPLAPETAQHHLPVERYAETLAGLKPKFIHHPRSKELVVALLTELGCDLERTFFDVPRLRTATSGGYLTSGIAYAFHPHRDTWYSAPPSQVNWWLPIFPFESGSGIAFHPGYFSRGIRNSSHIYNYYEWNKQSRADAANHIAADPRPQPKPEEPVDRAGDLRLVCPVGGAIVFSGAQLHSTVPNDTGRTRFSIDFRTVDLDDAKALRGAHNVDSACTGTSMRDFLSCRDQRPVAEEVAAQYDAGPPPPDAVLVYRPPRAAS